MNEHLDRLYEQLDRIEDRLNSVDNTLAGQKTSLDYHIKRTDMLESRVLPLEQWFWRVTGAVAISSALFAWWRSINK